MLRRTGDETIDFTDAREAIEAVLAKFGDLDGVSDVNISGGEASIRRRGVCTPVDVQVAGDELHDIANLIAAACNTEVNRKVPIVEQRIPPGYRVSFTHPTKVQGGSWNCSIRLLPTEVIPLGQYVEDGYLDLATAHRLVELADSRSTIVIAGSTGAGKTTLLRAMIHEVPLSRRLVIIEQGAELNVERQNMVALEAIDIPDFDELIRHSLRLDPDLIVVGEIRGREASRFITLAAAGHPCATTIHAESGEKALVRLHRMIRLAEPHFDRAELDGAVQAVVHVRLDPTTGARNVTLWEPQM